MFPSISKCLEKESSNDRVTQFICIKSKVIAELDADNK